MVKLFKCINIYFSYCGYDPMFYVEQHMKSYFFGLFFIILVACHPRDPNPELKDPIYQDLKKELALVDKNIETGNKELGDRKSILKGVIPQSGQLKSVEQKVFESEDYLEKLAQQKLFFEIKIEQRKRLVSTKYAHSLHGGPAWPDPKEVEDYDAEIKLQRAKIKWANEKGMVKKVPRGTIVTEESNKESEH